MQLMTNLFKNEYSYATINSMKSINSIYAFLDTLMNFSFILSYISEMAISNPYSHFQSIK